MPFEPPQAPSISQPASFDELLKVIARERAAVRIGVAEGHWRELEPNKQRAAAFAQRATAGLRNFAEVQIGATLDYQNASFLARSV